MSEIGLSEAIEALRVELSEALVAGQLQPMRFQIGQVNLVVEASVTKDANGKIGWKMLGVGGSIESAKTQRLELTLTPLWMDPTTKAYTSDFLVSGIRASLDESSESPSPHDSGDGEDE